MQFFTNQSKRLLRGGNKQFWGCLVVVVGKSKLEKLEKSTTGAKG